MAYFDVAICKRGHRAGRSDSKCIECGANVLLACPNCETSIRGGKKHVSMMLGDMVSYREGDYVRPAFCHSCGSLFPWASRKELIYLLQNQLDDEKMPDADRLQVREQLIALEPPDLDEAEQIRRWSKIKALAPRLMDTGQAIITRVAGEVIVRNL
ncbi:MAG: DUF2321 domain-containing protein [Acidimicrobiia bacterium]